MNNKLHLSDLVSELAKNTQKKEELTESFLRELFALIEEALLADQLVKIKEIGTFKLQLVNIRRIANVQTGETQEVPEHYKVVFTPDKRLASLVNEPYRHLSSVEIYENGEFKMIESGKEEVEDLPEVVSEEESAIGVSDTSEAKNVSLTEANEAPLKESVLAEMEIIVQIDPKEIPQKNSVEHHHTPIILPRMDAKSLAQLYQEEEELVQESEPETVIEPVIEPAPTTLVAEEAVSFEPIAPASSEPAPPESPKTQSLAHTFVPTDPKIEDQSVKSQKRSRGWIVATILLLISAGASYYYITHHRVPSNQIFQVVMGEPTPEEIADSLRQLQIDSLKIDIQNEPAQPEFKPLDTLKYEATRYLTQISRQYYGNKYFWVYIYEENKDKIADFNNVRGGTSLVIPAPEKYGIDANDTTSLNKAKEIGSRLVLEREVRIKNVK